MNDHEWLHENLDAYLAGGLDLDERVRAEAHLAACADCGHLHQNAKGLETYMANLFADARPDSALEDRVVARLRSAPVRRAGWLRFVAAAAAMIVVGLLGGIVQAVALEGGVPFLKLERSMTLRNHLTPLRTDAQTTFSRVGSTIGGKAKEVVIDEHAIKGADNKALDFDKDIQYGVNRIEDVSVPGALKPSEALGFQGGDKQAPPVNGPMQQGLGLAGGGGFGKPGKLTPPRSEVTKGFFNELNGRIDPHDLYNITVRPDSGKKQLGASYFYGVTPIFNIPPKKSDGRQVPKNQEAKDKEKEGLKNNLALGKKKGIQPEPEPDPGLKIIRTGEIEFQVESFDDAVARVVKLIGAVKGGFKLKEDSSKQTNGKTRGFVVVRMPPQFLDQFVLDLRRELAKMGADLRTQKIGSQDVTKQYTDTASELRAARAVEGRLIEIIKTGKGEVKDLIAAERELGTWRIKIEKMEGEIRYYNNQVSLSTLTIQLVEKEIEAASALVVNSTVQMRIETEDVSKARKAAEKAVADFKGRLIKSDEKQHAAGQIEAILHADIPPANKDAFKQALTKLGIVSASQAMQAQTTQGGSGRVLKLTPQVKDVRFEVTLMNIVNIMPKYSVTLDLATADVSANFVKLKDEILRLQGQVRTATKNEANPEKVTAQLSFNVPKEHKAALDKLLAEVGPVLKREASQATVTDVATDQKFGYAVNLYSVAVIAPRETVTMHIEVTDVDAIAAEMLAMARTSKGQASKVKSKIDPQGRRSAKLVMRVPLAASDALVKQFMAQGKIIDKDQTPNPQIPENELSTAHLVVELTGGDPIVPRDEGMSGYMRRSIYLGYTILVVIMTFVLTGLIVLVPCGFFAWVGYKIFGSSVFRCTPRRK
ncbi:MAG: DUF4349 domain-containing protein [Planctomycetes bacterium]|nr:DUF4349 domain-containing protein [Planctomycetota bacterium]